MSSQLSGAGLYSLGKFAFTDTFPYVVIVNSMTQGALSYGHVCTLTCAGMAIYSLIIFYFAFRDELRPIRPVYKVA